MLVQIYHQPAYSSKIYNKNFCFFSYELLHLCLTTVYKYATIQNVMYYMYVRIMMAC